MLENPAAQATYDPRWRMHAAVLAVGTFAVGTDAFVVAGVLPSIAGSLQVSLAQAGQVVTVFALAYACAAPFVGALTAGWPLRRTVLVALAVFTVGNALTAVAPTYATVLTSRVAAAVGAALYTASATSSAAALAGEARRGRAIAIAMFGLTSSLVLGTPVGTALGAALDWRATLWLVTALGGLAWLAVAVRLPVVSSAASAAGIGWRRFAPLADGRVRALLVCTFVAFLGIYLPYTYFSAVYAGSTGGSGANLAVLLLVFGLAGTVGNLLAGTLADRFGAKRVIVTATVLLAVVFAALPALQGSMLSAVPVAVVSGLLSFAVTTPQQQLIIALAPRSGAVVTSLYQSALYLAISSSGVVGALALDGWGAGSIGPFAAALVLAAALLTSHSGRLTRRGDEPVASCD